MKRFVRQCLIFLLVSVLMSATAVTVFSYAPSAELYNIYGDEMLFRRNAEAVFAGRGTPGAKIKVILSTDEYAVSSGVSTVCNDGKFVVSFTAPEGSYTEYTVRLYVEGVMFAELEKVVFGELWLASGQSNMQYGLGQSYRGAEMLKNCETGSKWLRVFAVPAVTEFDGKSGSAPFEEQEDIAGCCWFNGTDSRVYGMSAVAFFFAEKLLKDIDMPVGVLNASLGGSSIASWLSRDAIDSDPTVKTDFISVGEYITAEKWDKNAQSQYYDMTANFNLKIAPMRYFRPSGMIWYQGETDIIFNWTNNRYSRAFDLLQKSYTEHFNYTDGLLPIIYTQLASYCYGETKLQDMNEEFTAMQNLRSESRAMITSYDIPLNYLSEAGSIHPGYKQPIGERMEYAAMGLVYGSYDTYTAASVNNVEIKDGSVFVTLKNTGNGLVVNGEAACDFSVCGSDGIFVKACVDIVSNNTIRIYSQYVPEPVSATYAYSLMNGRANLYAKGENGILIPVAPFKTASLKNEYYRQDAAWTDCNVQTVWHTGSGNEAAYYDTWISSKCDISFSVDGMNIKTKASGNPKDFFVAPVLSYKENAINKDFKDMDYDLSDFGMLTVKIKNNGECDVDLKNIRIYTSSVIWFAPECIESGDTAYTVKAGSDTYTLTFDLNKLWLNANEGGAMYSNEKLNLIKKLRIDFVNTSGENADITVEDITFVPEASQTSDAPYKFVNNIVAADSLFEKFCAIFSALFAIVSQMFFPFVKVC